MRKLAIALAACTLSLNGCAALQGLAAPATTVAAHTAADEEALKRCETTYKLARTLMEIGVDSGLIRGGVAVTVAGLDNKLYGVLVTCRTAYRLFGSAELSRAADDMDKQAEDLGPAMKQGAD